ncbi:MAG: AAA family ATPase [Salinarimonas sp.]
MLIRFGVSNHRSIRDWQEISFVASPLKGGTSQTVEAPTLKQRLLPAALIYGANASGKSNVLDALAEMRRHVVDSFRKNEPTGRIARTPFALMEKNEAPTTFEIDLLLAGVRYTYGFDVTDRAFTREWLHAYPHGHRQVWFEREGAEPMRFGKGLKGANRAIEGFLRPNALFLSTAAQHGHHQLEIFAGFFHDEIEIIVDDVMPGWIYRGLCRHQAQEVLEFLSHADVGIDGFEAEPLHQQTQTTGAPGFLPRSELIKFKHRGSGGASYALSIEEESRGTRQMIALGLDALRTVQRGTVMVVDELDASLHTDLVLRLVSLFTDPRINTKGAQLLATTHDTNLLSSDILRRDQIWFTEKDREGATRLFPLTDFRTRREDNIERGYLDGRFGAVPYLGPLEAFARRHEEIAGG